MAYQCGALTQLSGITTSLMMLLTLLFLTPLVYYLPMFALAAIVITSVIPLVAFQQAIMLWRAKKVDLFLWVTSFLGVLFIGVLEGIAIAVILTLVVVVYESARPQMVVLWHIPGTSMYCNMKQEHSGGFVPNVLDCPHRFVNVFRKFNVYIKDTLKQFVKDLWEVNPVEYLVLEMTLVVSVDITVLTVIKDAIYTVSFGVFQKHHSALFTPDLPSKQKSALMNSGVSMVNPSHVLIQFPKVWWDISIPAWVRATLSKSGYLVLAARCAQSPRSSPYRWLVVATIERKLLLIICYTGKQRRTH